MCKARSEGPTRADPALRGDHGRRKLCDAKGQKNAGRSGITSRSSAARLFERWRDLRDLRETHRGLSRAMAPEADCSRRQQREELRACPHGVGVNPLPARSPRQPASHGSLTCPAHARHRGDHASSYTTPRDTIARGANLHRSLAGRQRPRSPAWPGRSGCHGSLIGAMVSRVPAPRAPGACPGWSQEVATIAHQGSARPARS
jgi:hypothetical protein